MERGLSPSQNEKCPQAVSVQQRDASGSYSGTHLPKRARLKTNSLPFRKTSFLHPGPWERGKDDFAAVWSTCWLRVDVHRKRSEC